MSIEAEDIFLSVVETNKGIIYKVVNSYCSNEEDRKDLSQEIVLQLWRSFHTYNEQYKYSTWMYRIALNVAISFYRKTKTRKHISHEFTESIFSFADSTNYIERKSHASLLQQFIAELKDLDKALMLLYLEEKSYKEIAEITGLSETNVATKLSRIKIILKQNFQK